MFKILHRELDLLLLVLNTCLIILSQISYLYETLKLNDLLQVT